MWNGGEAWVEGSVHRIGDGGTRIGDNKIRRGGSLDEGEWKGREQEYVGSGGAMGGKVEIEWRVSGGRGIEN